jgi:hypothetical protein
MNSFGIATPSEVQRLVIATPSEIQNFDFESYYEKYGRDINRVKPAEFVSNDITWKVTLFLYGNFFIHDLKVFEVCLGGYKYVPKNVDIDMLAQLCNMTDDQLTKFFDKIINGLFKYSVYLRRRRVAKATYLQKAVVENWNDLEIDSKCVVAHIKKSLHKLRKN